MLDALTYVLHLPILVKKLYEGTMAWQRNLDQS